MPTVEGFAYETFWTAKKQHKPQEALVLKGQVLRYPRAMDKFFGAFDGLGFRV